MLVKITNSAKETKSFAQEILKSLNSNLICLYGDLGSGKTTFVQGLTWGLGIKENIVSPTFTFIREYPIKNYIFTYLYHIDCYRLDSSEDFRSVNLSEFWLDPLNLIIIEWADKIKEILPKNRIDIEFKYLTENSRKLVIL